MEEIDKTNLQILDKLEETLTDLKRGSINDITTLFKKSNPKVEGQKIISLLEILCDKGNVRKEKDEPYNHYKYWLIKKHPIGHYKEALNNEHAAETAKQTLILEKEELRKEKQEQDARLQRENEKRDLEILKLRWEVKWFKPLLVFTIIGMLCGIISIGIDISEYINKQSEKSVTQSIIKQ